MNIDMILLIVLITISFVMLLLMTIHLLRDRKDESRSIEEIIHREVNELMDDLDDSLEKMNRRNQQNSELIGTMLKNTQDSSSQAQERQLRQVNTGMHDQLLVMRDSLNAQLDDFRKTVDDRMSAMDRRIGQLSTSTAQSMETIRTSMNESMSGMRTDNDKKLDEIRATVDEKLQSTLEKRITESFRTVSEQLEKVYKGLGEMQALAGDVGSLKKVLSGVKTRGILGEIQLSAILEEILTPDQYETNVATIPGSSERVEFAVRLPGVDDKCVYLPIDSKFPGERYQQLLDAQESGNKAAVDAAYKELARVITSEAKDISEKYIRVPHTTNFGIMFLPFEGLYAEVVSHGLLEKLQHDYNINIAGPSTMAALLNSLQMGFRTLAIRKHSNEIFNVLVGVQNEFNKFEGVMSKMQKHLRQTSDDLDDLMGTRTRALQRQLDKVQKMGEPSEISQSDQLLLR